MVSGIHNYYSPQYLAHSGQPRIGVMYTQVLPGRSSVSVCTEGSINKADALITLLQYSPYGHYCLARRAYPSASRTGLIIVLAGQAL